MPELANPGWYTRPNDKLEFDDERLRGERDRDRILYSSALRRLAGITQVASPVEGRIVHNRLTHTLQVAQVAQRAAQRLAERDPEVAEAIGGLDHNVAEAAGLAHDLGHPPFGHLGETELCRLVEKHGVTEGFEGNAQSFRIVARLSYRFESDLYHELGLNLTRATLAAILKYPWHRAKGKTAGKKWAKFGAYSSEREVFKFARDLMHDPEPSIEAEIMDFADDVAYSVHDVEDFYRAGLIPLDRVILDDQERDRFLDGTMARWAALKDYERPKYSKETMAEALERVIGVANWFPQLERPYDGGRIQRAELRSFSSRWISKFVTYGIRLRRPTKSNPKRVALSDETMQEITILKELNWYYVIESTALITQQIGQRAIVSLLYERFLTAAMEKDYKAFPVLYREQIQNLGEPSAFRSAQNRELARTVADLISNMTEAQAIDVFRRITGQAIGSVMDPVLRV